MRLEFESRGVAMAWWRSLLAEIFPAWHERQLLRKSQADNGARLDALQRFRRAIAMQDKADKARPRAIPARDANAKKQTGMTSPMLIPTPGHGIDYRDTERPPEDAISKSDRASKA
jgi:hypothetical protein